MAHFPPSSLRTEAMAATQGVYSRLNTSNDAAASGVSTVAMLLPNNTSRVATTLSFAMNPLIREVQIRQSPRPSGRNSGTSRPDTVCRILNEIQFQVKALQEPYHDGGNEDHSECFL